jgi:hypothetical protein
MASYPFGLREDPFAAGFELSPEETRQLVQNRVSACGGDGATLFPPETCAEIHRRAYGVASAALKLAEHALLRAAREGAPWVSAAHVRPEGSASSTPVEAPSASKPQEVPPLPKWTEGTAPPPPGATPLAKRTERTAPPPPEAPAAAAKWTQSPSEPPPSSVGRSTVPAAGPAPHRSPTAPPPPKPQNWMATHLSPPEAPSPDPVHWAASVAVFMLFAVGAVFLILRLNPAAGTAVRSLARTAGAEAPADLPVLDDDSALVVYRAPAPASVPAPARVAPAPAPADSSLVPRLGLEVARFIVQERAQAERKRLAGRGLKTSVVTGWDGGAPSFSVVVGPFPSTGEAERVADQLLAGGLVSQARVVTLKKPASRPPGR